MDACAPSGSAPTARARWAAILASTATVAAFAFVAVAASPPARAAVGAGQGDSGPAVASDTSAPLASYAGAAEPVASRGVKKEHFDKRDAGLPQKTAGTSTAVAQTAATTATATAGIGFEGLGIGLTGFAVNSAPPDTDAAVSPTQIVEVVNSGLAVFDKNGHVLYGPVLTSTLFSGFGGPCQTTNDGDGVVRWDRAAGRWVIAQFANASSPSGPYYECVAVSQTGDATGAYYRYAFRYSYFPDYPKLGVWPDAYYITYNLFSGNTFKGAQTCALDRNRMRQGLSATQQCKTTSTGYGGLLPVDNVGAVDPPSGEPALHVALGTNGSSLAYWKFRVDWTTPANSTWTGPTALPVDPFSQACGGGTCIPQKGTTNQLDSLADRLMYHLSYRRIGNTESMVVTHSVVAGSSTGIRWYELQNPVSPVVAQQGTWAPDGDYRWMGSAAMDGSGGIALGYSASSASTNPSIRFAGRTAGAAPGTLNVAEGLIVAGTGSQSGSNLHRWGDYASMSIDPADDCTFWFASEYLSVDGAFNWNTRIGSFTLPGCSAAVRNDFTLAVSPASGSVQQGATSSSTVTTGLASGSAEPVTLSASGLPTGVSASFSPNPVTAGSSATLTLTTSLSTVTGNYPITVTGSAPSAQHATTYTLTVTAGPGGTSPVVVNGGFEGGTLSPWTGTGPAYSLDSVFRSGASSARVGATAPTNGLSSLVQTFTAPAGSPTLSFWWTSSCPDTVTYDWAIATLKDNGTGTTTTVLPKTCATFTTWRQVTATLVGGHSYTLTLSSRDDNYAGDPTFTRYDDVTVS